MKALFIGAHQDDVEYEGCGLAMLLREQGHDVRFLSCCNGNGGHHEMTPEETTARRAGESRAVEKFLDVEYLVWSDMSDCTLTASLENRRRMIREIRRYAPDLIVTHRTNDYHADHRATAQLVQDASYLLIVPHECPDVPALRKMPVILFFEDPFQEPPFKAGLVIDIDRVAEKKFQSLSLNESQVYEWIPYSDCDLMPPPASEPEKRYEWLLGLRFTPELKDKDILCGGRGLSPLFAKTTVRFRRELIKRYGRKHGKAVRYSEAFGVSEYGSPLTKEFEKEMLPF